jgi:hypothetical protein
MALHAAVPLRHRRASQRWFVVVWASAYGVSTDANPTHERKHVRSSAYTSEEAHG